MESIPNGGADQFGGGNYLFIQHGTGSLYSLYYHLKQNGVLPAWGTPISEGQHVAYSGDTGLGPAHLHYELSSLGEVGCVGDPDGWCDLDPRQWTTTPGRVPWRADFVSEDSPAGYSMFQWSTVTTWVKFKNVGGRPWPLVNDPNGKNRIRLVSITPPASPNRDPFSTRVSSFYVSGNWEASSIPGAPDGGSAIPLNGTATFTFQLRGSQQGTFNERFNLKASNNFWFDYWEPGYFAGWYIPITVNHCC